MHWSDTSVKFSHGRQCEATRRCASARKPAQTTATGENLHWPVYTLLLGERLYPFVKPRPVVEAEACLDILVVMGNASKVDESSDKATAAPRRARSTPLHRSAHIPLRKRALRTKEHIIDTAKSLFLKQGYAATTIDDIAVAAGVSRASFYTYFSSRREIMIIAGHDARHESLELVEQLRHFNKEELHKEFEGWISRYFTFLSNHGGYLLTWQQAALQDNELRVLGMRGSKRATDILAESFKMLGSRLSDADLNIRSLAIRAMLDRFWYHWRITKTPIKQKAVLENFADMIISMILGSDTEVPPVAPPKRKKKAVADPVAPEQK